MLVILKIVHHLDYHRIKVHAIAKSIGISEGCMRYILHEELLKNNFVLGVVPLQIKKYAYEYIGRVFNKNRMDFVHWFVMINETSIYH